MPKKKIYIVDDDHDIVEAMTIVLTKNGFEVGAQYNDKNVEKNVKAFGPDLIILDVMFPEHPLAGFTIARQLRNNDELKHIPILMLSAINERVIYVSKFSDNDVDDSYLPVNVFMEKPLKPNVLLERVNKLIGH